MNCVIDEEEGGRGRGERRMKFHMYTARTGSERERESCLFSRLRTRDTHTQTQRAPAGWNGNALIHHHPPTSFAVQALGRKKLLLCSIGRVRFTINSILIHYGRLRWTAPSASFFPT
jgi:hypothetical protein